MNDSRGRITLSALDILKRLYAENDRIMGRTPADLRLSHVLDEAALEEIETLAAREPASPVEAIEHLSVAAYCMDETPAAELIEGVSRMCATGSITGSSLAMLRETIAICDACDHPHVIPLLETVLVALRRPKIVR